MTLTGIAGRGWGKGLRFMCKCFARLPANWSRGQRLERGFWFHKVNACYNLRAYTSPQEQ